MFSHATTEETVFQTIERAVGIGLVLENVRYDIQSVGKQGDGEVKDAARRVQSLGKEDMILAEEGRDRLQGAAQRFPVKFLESSADIIPEQGHAEYISERTRIRQFVAEDDLLLVGEVFPYLTGVAVGGRDLQRIPHKAADCREEPHIIIIVEHLTGILQGIPDIVLPVVGMLLRQQEDRGKIMGVKGDDMAGDISGDQFLEHLQRTVIGFQRSSVLPDIRGIRDKNGWWLPHSLPRPG